MWTERWRCGGLRSFNNPVVVVDTVSERLDIRVVVGARWCHIYRRCLPPSTAFIHCSVIAAVYTRVHWRNQPRLSRLSDHSAGDLNQLSDKEILERTGLMSIVHQPTRGTNILDRIYVSSHEYSTVRIVASTVRSDHGAVVAYCCTDQCTLPKTHQQRIYRPITPNQHAQFLNHLSTIDIDIAMPQNDVQAEFSHFYNLALALSIDITQRRQSRFLRVIQPG